MTLRPHHLLCLRWFVGEGYSSEFSKNMKEIFDKLNKPNSKFKLKLENDSICIACPNLNALNICTSIDKVSSMDLKVLTNFELNTDEVYSYSAIYNKIGECITDDIIKDICSDCEWFPLGLCWI